MCLLIEFLKLTGNLNYKDWQKTGVVTIRRTNDRGLALPRKGADVVINGHRTTVAAVVNELAA